MEKEIGNKLRMRKANGIIPKAAAKLAFKMMRVITPIFTALPIRLGLGFWNACQSGGKRKMECNTIKGIVIATL
jgi:hypothetical protein